MAHADNRQFRILLMVRFPRLMIGFLACIWPWGVAAAALSMASTPGIGFPSQAGDVALETGKSVERELAGGEAHTYRIQLDSGMLLRAIVDQHNIDVVVAIYGPDEKTLTDVDRPNGVRGPEAISVIAKTSGDYRLVIRSLEKVAAPGRYQVSIKELRSVLPQDEKRIEAEHAISEGERLRARGTAESLRKAISQFDLALNLWRSISKEEYEEAIALYGIGWAHSTLGEYQQAIQFYSQSNLLLQTQRTPEGISQVQKGLAWAHLYTGEIDHAREYFSQALQLDRALGNARGEGIALYGLGWVSCFAKENQQALEYFSRSLAIRRAMKDRRGEALALAGIARVYRRSDEKRSEALDYLKHALEILRGLGDQNGEADILSNIGWVYYSLRQNDLALDYFERALQLCITIGDRPCEATTRYGIAALADQKGQLQEASRQMEAALAIIESLRTKGANQQLRSSYLSATQEYYDFYIQTRMKLNRLYPQEGHAAVALQASERARARSLLETLLEASIDLRRGVDPAMLERERQVQERINDTAFRRRQLLAAKKNEQAATLTKEIEGLTIELQEVLARIREYSPQYASLTQPAPLTVGEIQQQLLDRDTVLLEYSLVDTQSYLWLVSSDSLASFALPGRAEIETAALRVYDLLTARNQSPDGEAIADRQRRIAQADAQFPEAAARLSRTLLGPAARQIGGKRLLIVADGVLQFIPFGVLPDPEALESQAGQYRPLIVEHEVVSLPSASTLGVLRRDWANRRPAPREIAILADPIFKETDERVRRPDKKAPDKVDDEALRDLRRATEDLGDGETATAYKRLIYTREEANRIASFAPSNQVFKALDFKASRATALHPDLGQYRIVHFASHSIINNVHPDLSGIVFSLVDEQARAQDGFLRAHDIYNLKLPAELIMLSACRTGIGRQIRGEGLISLTRGFMYAGARRVGVSLWSVDDRASAELMVKFYRQMLGPRHVSPAAALRAAQVEMWGDKRWSQPYYWGAFALQGEWR